MSSHIRSGTARRDMKKHTAHRIQAKYYRIRSGTDRSHMTHWHKLNRIRSPSRHIRSDIAQQDTVKCKVYMFLATFHRIR